MQPPPRGEIVTRDRCAAIFGIAKTTLDAWVRKGCPVYQNAPRKGVPAQYDTAAVAEWQVNRALVETDNTDPVLEKERARLAKEQADKIAMENATARRELLPAADVRRADEAIFTALRDRLMSIPTSIAQECLSEGAAGGVAAVSETIRQALEAALEQIGSAEIEATDDLDDQGDGRD